MPEQNPKREDDRSPQTADGGKTLEKRIAHDLEARLQELQALVAAFQTRPENAPLVAKFPDIVADAQRTNEMLHDLNRRTKEMMHDLEQADSAGKAKILFFVEEQVRRLKRVLGLP